MKVEDSDQQDLIGAMGRYFQTQYPGADLHIVQTHISILFLIGDRAYKLKKSIKLPFLDFSSLAQRKFYLQEELRLNRRQCPDLYLGLHAVCGSVQEGLTLDSVRLPIIDYVLEMRRFEERFELAKMAAAGELRSEHIESLAQHLAHFHLGLAPVFEAETDKRTEDWAHESFSEISEYLKINELPIEYTEQLNVYRNRLLTRFSELQDWRDARRMQGFVRECHGDLHLGNMVLWQGHILGFDALEFDSNLRTIDVIQDVAFVFMDLHVYGLEMFAWDFINLYLEQTGDYEAMTLLILYSAYKALVRAKITLLSHDDAGFKRYWRVLCSLMEHPSLQDASMFGENRAAKMNLAQTPSLPKDASLVSRASQAVLLLMLGISGSGKSVVARVLAQEIHGLRIRADAERKRLHREGKLRDEQNQAIDLYSKRASMLMNKRLDAVSHYLLNDGFHVIVDTVSPHQERREVVRSIAIGLGAQFYLVQVQVPVKLLKKRLDERLKVGRDISDATYEIAEQQRNIMQEIPQEWSQFTWCMDNDGDLENVKRKVNRMVAQILHKCLSA